MDQIVKDLTELKDFNLERRLPLKVRLALARKLGLRRARVMQCLLMPDSKNELIDPVYDACESGRITYADEYRIEETDLILRAKRSDGSGFAWVAVESSATVTLRDISLARESSNILEVVFGGNVVAAVCGYDIQPEDERRADEMGVAVLLIEPAG